MKKLMVGFAAVLLSVGAFATGPWVDPGVRGDLSQHLSAVEQSDDGSSYVSIYRWEYAEGWNYGVVSGVVGGNFFDCDLDHDNPLLEVSDDVQQATIAVDYDDVEFCWSGELPAPIAFQCVPSGYMTSQGVSNYETTYYDGFVYRSHSKFLEKSVDCSVTIGEDIVFNATAGAEGWVRVEKSIQPNMEERGD